MREEVKGAILEVNGDTFIARLFPAGDEFDAELPCSIFPDGEQHLIQPGNVFVWRDGVAEFLLADDPVDVTDAVEELHRIFNS